MADSVELKVGKEGLEQSEKILSTLADNLVNRQLDISFSQARGSVADELVLAAEQLNTIRTALYSLITKTRSIVRKAAVDFDKADKSAAKYFNPLEK